MIPETRSEIFLANIAGEQNELPAPQSRIEHYLNAIAQAGDIHGGSAGAVIYDKDASYPDGSVGAAMQEMDGEISENTSDISQLKSEIADVEKYVGAFAVGVPVPAPSGSTDLFTSSDVSEGDTIYYSITTGTGTPSGYNAYIELQNSGGSRLAIYGKTTIATTATEYEGSFVIPSGFSKAVLKGTCAGAFLRFVSTEDSPAGFSADISALEGITSDIYSKKTNLIVPTFDVPYERTLSGVTANSRTILSVIDNYLGPAFTVKKDKYYLMIYRFSYGEADTENAYSQIEFQITNNSWTQIGTDVLPPINSSKKDVSGTWTLVKIVKMSADNSGARCRVLNQGGNGGAGTAYTLDIITHNIMILEYDSFEEASDIYYKVFGGNNQNELDNSGIWDFKEPLSDAEPVGLLCWGDSLTAGAGGNGTNYPKVCAEELGLTYRNCGVGGETANTIAARQGGNSVLIPAGAINGTYSSFTDVFGGTVAPLVQGNGNFSGNALYINDDYCGLALSSGTYTISGYDGTTSAMPLLAKFRGSKFEGKIVVIFAGANGATVTGASGVDARIAIIDSMIKHIGHDRYVVFANWVTNGTESGLAADDAAMLAHYGNKLFPMRKMLVNYGLDLMGITPTAQDETDIAAGTIPTSLRDDAVHLNADGYTAVGKFLADKIRSLGYV